MYNNLNENNIDYFLNLDEVVLQNPDIDQLIGISDEIRKNEFLENVYKEMKITELTKILLKIDFGYPLDFVNFIIDNDDIYSFLNCYDINDISLENTFFHDALLKTLDQIYKQYTVLQCIDSVNKSINDIIVEKK